MAKAGLLSRRPNRLPLSERKRRRRSLTEDAFNVPNLLTMARVAVIPLVIMLLGRGSPKDCVWAALVYSAAAITDLLDGYLARRMNVVSVLGKFMDPLADKLLVMAVLVYMVPMGRIGEPGEVAGVINFLMSDDAAYITRQVIGVNGGMV